MTTAAVFRDALSALIPADAKEADNKARALSFLTSDRTCFERSNLERHFCGSAAIVSPDRSKILLIRHAKLGRWLQPGGHCDGDPDVLGVAGREVQEETGLAEARSLGKAVFDFDIHAIPEHKSVPPHEHYDAVFLFEADPAAPLRRSETETTGIAWRTVVDLAAGADARLVRIARKILRQKEAA